jgi:glycosyltransferase involved in cell wall biosynthesis
MRIAWLGPAPTDDAGVSYMAGQLLRGLSNEGISVDAFLDATERDVPPELLGLPGLSFNFHSTGWEYGKWYSSAAFTKFATGLAARAAGQLRLTREVARSHARRRYHALYQFSHLDATAVRPFARWLPPLVVHPETHIAGELRWHRAEDALSRRCEPRLKRMGVRAVLTARAASQRRSVGLPRCIVAPSAVFRDELVRDYGVPLERFAVVPNPIDLVRYQPPEVLTRGEPLRIVFVSRIVVRKGVELIVGLSHRLRDLAGRVRLEVIGDRALWSDYRPLLNELDPEIAVYRGYLRGPELAASIRTADVLVQPSYYEPFGLTVGEALASGVPVVVSEAVGAAGFVDGPAVTRFTPGDLDAFEGAVRSVLDQVGSTSGRQALGIEARMQAERAFSLDVVAPQVRDVLESL